MQRLKERKAITLIALVITVIVLLILAGITISLTIGQDGIILRAQEAGKNYIAAQENENVQLGQLVNEADSIITGQSRGDGNVATQATGIKTDTYIYNIREVTSIYEIISSMEGFTKTTDENNKISEYLSYSDEEGYTVLKEGWYFVNMRTYIQATSAADVLVNFNINGTEIAHCFSWASKSNASGEYNSFSIYLAEGDKIYFSARAAGSTATSRKVQAWCYPMF